MDVMICIVRQLLSELPLLTAFPNHFGTSLPGTLGRGGAPGEK